MSNWSAMAAEADHMLRAFCCTDETPTNDQLVEAVRDVFPRFGWRMDRLDFNWGDILDGARHAVDLPPPPSEDIAFDSLYHRVVACCALLGWVDAPWSVFPCPTGWRYEPDMPWPRASQGRRRAVPVFPTPKGWPLTLARGDA